MRGRYILIGQTPVACEDLMEWGQWMEVAERWVFLTKVGDYEVSTVFLGLDHNHMRVIGRGEPLLFETMIFLLAARNLLREPGESLEQWYRRRWAIEEEYGDERLLDSQWRYTTWMQAEAGHERAVRLVETTLNITRTDAKLIPQEEPK